MDVQTENCPNVSLGLNTPCNAMQVWKLTSKAKFETRADATDMVVQSFHVGFAFSISVYAQRNPPFWQN